MKAKRSWVVAAGTAAALVVLASCGGDKGTSGGSSLLSGQVRVDGSSTVAPLTIVASELFAEEQGRVQVVVGTSGTGGGFEKFCNGETQIADASRTISDEEKASCAKNSVQYQEFQVANDALTVVVNKENTWAKCLTTSQLKAIWSPGSKVDNWSQVDRSYPNEPLKLFGPGTDSGTFDYFTDAINGEEGASRTDYGASENDNVIVQGVEGSKGGLGYFGYSYYEENAGKLNAVAIDSGNGCVEPSVETAQSNEYSPLSRPLFIYPSAKALKQPQVLGFVEFFVENAADIAEQAKFVPLNSAQQTELAKDLDALKAQAGQ